MRKLRWDVSEFVECLEVLPREGYIFEKEVDGLSLVLKVWEFENYIDLSLRRNEHKLISQALFVRGAVELKKEGPSEYLAVRTGYPEYLSLTNCLILPSRFVRGELRDLFNEELYPIGYDVKISIKPDISIVYNWQPGQRFVC